MDVFAALIVAVCSWLDTHMLELHRVWHLEHVPLVVYQRQLKEADLSV